MGEDSLIGWCHHTINVWKGCAKVSAGCKFCYAQFATPIRVRRAGGLELWGVDAAREETQNWAQDLRRWNREALASGKVCRVFGQSMADTFEDRRDLDPLRAKFFAVIEQCQALTFELLTKRPQHIQAMVPPSWLEVWPANAWIGCTAESQETAEERIPHLLRVPARVRFLSIEPQIAPVDLEDLVLRDEAPGEGHYSALECDVDAEDDHDWRGASIAWVICGGESGAREKVRPFELSYARSLRDQCGRAGVPFFFKQAGSFPRGDEGDGPRVSLFDRATPGRLILNDRHGADEAELPEDLRDCRAFPVAA